MSDFIQDLLKVYLKTTEEDISRERKELEADRKAEAAELRRVKSSFLRRKKAHELRITDGKCKVDQIRSILLAYNHMGKKERSIFRKRVDGDASELAPSILLRAFENSQFPRKPYRPASETTEELPLFAIKTEPAEEQSEETAGTNQLVPSSTEPSEATASPIPEWLRTNRASQLESRGLRQLTPFQVETAGEDFLEQTQSPVISTLASLEAQLEHPQEEQPSSFRRGRSRETKKTASTVNLYRTAKQAARARNAEKRKAEEAKRAEATQDQEEEEVEEHMATGEELRREVRRLAPLGGRTTPRARSRSNSVHTPPPKSVAARTRSRTSSMVCSNFEQFNLSVYFYFMHNC
ncbi:hypothetical protein L596_012719 [Steinernema carpocapsae]|uniref:Uncharacterized protein n=1 Tax=Steinernema carpocapsae TaxID=34508 RepID=A0A4V6A4X1_STECR|nr:hypothetical protein L596_012719 [Steinernema carpocapsae]